MQEGIKHCKEKDRVGTHRTCLRGLLTRLKNRQVSSIIQLPLGTVNGGNPAPPEYIMVDSAYQLVQEFFRQQY